MTLAALAAVVYGGASSISPIWVSGSSSGRDGTRPSKSWPRWSSSGWPPALHKPCLAGKYDVGCISWVGCGGPGTIPAIWVSGNSSGRDGTRPSKSWPRWSSSGWPPALHKPCLAGKYDVGCISWVGCGGPGTIPAIWVSGSSSGRDGTRPSKPWPRRNSSGWPSALQQLRS